MNDPIKVLINYLNTRDFSAFAKSMNTWNRAQSISLDNLNNEQFCNFMEYLQLNPPEIPIGKIIQAGFYENVMHFFKPLLQKMGDIKVLKYLEQFSNWDELISGYYFTFDLSQLEKKYLNIFSDKDILYKNFAYHCIKLDDELIYQDYNEIYDSISQQIQKQYNKVSNQYLIFDIVNQLKSIKQKYKNVFNISSQDRINTLSPLYNLNRLAFYSEFSTEMENDDYKKLLANCLANYSCVAPIREDIVFDLEKTVFEEFEKIINQYQLKSFSFEKNLAPKFVLEQLKHILYSAKLFFNLEDNEVGEGCLKLNILQSSLNDNVEQRNNNSYFPKLNILFIDNYFAQITNLNVDNIFIHEYTHFRQDLVLNNDKKNKVINSDLNSFSQWSNLHESIKNYKTNISDIISLSYNLFNKTPETKKGLMLSPEFLESMLSKKKINLNVIKDTHVQLIIEKLHKIYHQNNYSYEFNYFQFLEEQRKKNGSKIKEYYTKSNEIHARMNQKLYDNNLIWQDEWTESSFMYHKPQLQEFNQLMINTYRKNKILTSPITSTEVDAQHNKINLLQKGYKSKM